jgi:hypothetical protein
MKTIILEGNKVQVSDESFEALKKSLIKEERWVPEYEDDYFYVDNMGDKEHSTWQVFSSDYFRLGQNNVFKTEEEAEAHAKKLHAISKITNYCWENGLAKEWVAGEENWYIFWDSRTKDFYISWNTKEKALFILPYLKSKEACIEVIEKFEDELKLIFEV